MENNNFRGVPTSLFLNGPKLGIATDPQDQLEVVGVATFTGIATVTAGDGGAIDSSINDLIINDPGSGFTAGTYEAFLNGTGTGKNLVVTVSSGEVTSATFQNNDSGTLRPGDKLIINSPETSGISTTAEITINGSIIFKWYLGGTEVKDINIDNDSRATIVGFTSATGYGTTITFNALTTDDSGKEVYFTADYIPTAYSQPAGSAVTVGSARSTGNANNDPLQSESAILTILPIIDVTSEPSGQLVSRDDDARFSVEAQKTPGGDAVNYQWQLNGNDLSDGSNQSLDAFDTAAAGEFTITRGSEPSITIDATQLSSYDDFVTGEIYTIVASTDIETNLFAFGADGATNARTDGNAGKGGIMQGPFTFLKDQTYKLVIGKVGTPNFVPELKHGAGGKSTGGGANSGGGFTGLFKDEVTHENAILIAGGGGSSAKGDYRAGGNGGGLDAVDNAAPWSTDSGGNQEQGGLGFYDTRDGQGTYGTQYRYMTGKKFFGGFNNGGATNNNGGAGGGGYYGGGAGRADSNYSPGPFGGGGGSGFSDPNLVNNAQSSTGGADYDRKQQARVAGEGQFRIEIVSTAKNVIASVSGAQTKNLTISADSGLNSTVRCKLTATGVQQSPVFSKTVSYVVVQPRPLIEIETYNYTDATATLSEFDLSDGDLTIDYATYEGNAVCLYAGDQDIEIEMEMYGGKGIGFDEEGGTNAVENFRWSSGFEGGEGGYSKIRFTMERNDEYILTGLFPGVNAPFLYRKGTLIACVGEGGWGGHYGRGGSGGGVKTSGENGQGRHSGIGGVRFLPGNLPSEKGIFGSRFIDDLQTVAPDEQALGNSGGRTIPCPKGDYWRRQGKAPCEDLGTIKFRTPNGTEISNTATISRGYKSGYNILQTGGTRGASDGGNGGNGATGGEGGNSSGGGGGSGYHDGSITEVATQHGGGRGDAKVIIRISDPSVVNPGSTLFNVIFTVRREAAYSNTITFVKESGEGPDRITFGPNEGTVTVLLGFGAVYTRESVLVNGAPGGQVKLSGITLSLEDSNDNDYNDLTVTPDRGRFTSDSRYEFTRSSETVTFTQSRTSNENLGFTMTIVSGTGDGPQTIRFGSRPGFNGTLPSTVTAKIQQGTVYEITETNGVDSTSLSDDGTLTVSDLDSNPGSLSVTPDNGEWTSTSRYEFT